MKQKKKDLVPAVFYFGPEECMVKGFHFPKDRWNGFCNPYFDLKGMRVIRKYFIDNNYATQGTTEIKIKRDGTVWAKDLYEEQGWEKLEPSFGDLYFLGGGWTWEEKVEIEIEKES